MTWSPLRSGLRLSALWSALAVAGPVGPPSGAQPGSSFCARCGSSIPAGATYCPSCGAPITKPSSSPAASPAYPGPGAPYYTLPMSPQREGASVALILTIVVIAVVATFVTIYVVSSLAMTPTLPPTGTPRAIGVAVSKSPDGTNWTLTFTSVPTGLSPATTYMKLNSASGATLLPSTPLNGLDGMMSMMGSSGMVYMQYQAGMMSTVSAGDMVRIGTTFAGTGSSTMGCQVQITITGATLYSGTLQ